MTHPAVLNIDDAAHYVGLSALSFRRDVDAGIIPAPLPTTTRRKRWSVAALDQWLQGRDKYGSDPIAEAINAAYPKIHSGGAA